MADDVFERQIRAWASSETNKKKLALAASSCARALPAVIAASNDANSTSEYTSYGAWSPIWHLSLHMTRSILSAYTVCLNGFNPSITNVGANDRNELMLEFFNQNRPIASLLRAIGRSSNFPISAYQTAAAAESSSRSIQNLDKFIPNHRNLKLAQEATNASIAILEGSDPKTLLEQSLWLDVTWPDEIADSWTNLKAEWSTEPAMAFWIDWYEGLLAGRTPDWGLWHDIVLIDDEHWEAGPAAVAREIELVKARLVAKRAPQDETIEIDEQTGKFKLKFSEPAKPDLLGATLDQIGDALEDAMANPNNGLHERSREVLVLQRSLSKYANSPQRLEMDFTSVHGSLTRQIAKDELPPSEENLALLQATQEGAQGIRATHPDIAENRAILQNRAIAEMSKENRDFVQDSVEVLEDLSQGILAEEFVEDAAEIYEQEAEAENHRKLGVYERNPGLVARDEKIRLFSRAAKMLILVKKTPDLIHKVSNSATGKAIGWLGTLASIVALGITLL